MSLQQHFYHLHNGDPNIYLLQDDFVSRIDTTTIVIATWRVNTTGQIGIVGTSGNFLTYDYNWKTPTTSASSYYVRFTELSGFGTYNLPGPGWLALTSIRTATATASAGDPTSSVSFTVEIAKNSDGSEVIARAEITVQADKI